MTKHNARITIVGAGLAGLTAAYRLRQAGHRSTVYEARGRPGGRVCTAVINGSYEEMGGKNISDGGEAEAIEALADELSLLINTHEFKGPVQTVIEGEVNPFYKIFHGMEPPTEELYDKLKEQSLHARNLGEIMDSFLGKGSKVRKLLETIVLAWEGSSSFELAPQSVCSTFWQFYQMAYLAEQSGKEIEPQITFRSIKGGNSRLVQALAKPVEDSIQYNHALTSIARDDRGIHLQFKGGQTVTTDYLVLALPCTTLRLVDIQKGIIPQDQWHAIKSLQYGTNAKIVVPVQKVSKPAADFVITDKSMNAWMSENRSLVTWYYGGLPGCFDSGSKLEIEGKISQDIEVFQKGYSNVAFLKNNPNPFVDNLFESYEGPVAVSWINDKYALGSYSNCGVDQHDWLHTTIQEHGETIRKVFRSIDGKVFFAGEHCSETAASTMEGAVMSGNSAAKQILSFLSVGQKK
ncbi:MAG: NAD(P)/FAD-dependent oxidoreductase [Chlamydiales bacterium]|nr:NAD(P)/FAD-dependent oxidoreductase [Chlamydiales bacterium]